jgi:hypothetical protein
MAVKSTTSSVREMREMNVPASLVVTSKGENE